MLSRFTALFEKARPGSNVVLAPKVVAELEVVSGMILPRNATFEPIEAAPAGTQNMLVLVAFAAPLNVRFIVFAVVKSPLERKM